MKAHYHIYVNAPVSSVWKVLSDPNLMALWNPHCIRCRAGEGPFGIGFTYQAIFKLNSGPERTAVCTIEEYQPEKLLTTTYSITYMNRTGNTKETFHLSPKNQGTKINQTIDFSRSGTPIIIQLLIKLMQPLGHSVRKGPLKRIKELIENQEFQQNNATNNW
jgi:uncharacterized protein YndB with AHSA1/START domain